MKSWRLILPLIWLVGLIAVPCAVPVTHAASSAWATVTPMTTPRYGLTAATGPDSRMYAIGGYNAAGYLRTAEAYAPVSHVWSAIASMQVARYAAAAVAWGDYIYVLGGYNPVSGYLASVERYSPWTNAWTTVPSMPTARAGLAAVLGTDGHIYAIGGFNGLSYLSTVEVYTPWTNSWTAAPAMPTARGFLGGALGAASTIYAVGGRTAQSPVATVEAYSIPSGTWTPATPLTTARAELAAVPWTDGRIFALGGRSGLNAFYGLASTEAYNIDTKTWLADAPMLSSRYGLATTRGPDNLVYALGGMSSGVALASVEAYGPLPPQPTVPGTPANVHAASAVRTATVSWTAPYNGGSPITGYTITTYVGTSSLVTGTTNAGPNVTSAQVTGLSDGATYTFTVRAANAVGWGSESARSPAITLPALPGIPASVMAVAGINAVTVSWLPPLSNGGSPIIAYIVTGSTGIAGQTVTVWAGPDVSSVNVGNLVPGRAYSFWVQAVNAVGTGPASTATAAVTLPTVPSAPLGLTLTPTGTSLQVSWLPPALGGGRPIISYQVTLWQGSQLVQSQQVATTAAAFTGLHTGSTYTVSVVATNMMGSGDPAVQTVLLPNLAPTITVPADQRVDHGDIVSFTVSARDPDPTDHVTLTAGGLPSGVTFTDLGNGTGQVSGYAAVSAGTYSITFTACDQHNAMVSKAVTVTVTREIAIVDPYNANPVIVKVNSPRSTSAGVTLHASIYEATDPNGNADIGEAAPVVFTLIPFGGGQTYSVTANHAGGGIEGTLETTATFRHLPVNMYHVHIEIGGNDYQGTADSILTVYSPSATGAVSASGKILIATPGSFKLTAKYLKNGKAGGSLQYVEYRALAVGAPMNKRTLIESYVLNGKITGLVIKNHRAYLQGTGTLNGVQRYSFVVTVMSNSYRHQADQFGLWVTDPQHAMVGHFTFLPTNLTGGSATIVK
ncbi:MAG TPA: fibronectin type III domain-containing protein [Chloroflexota bacterium]|nr:fibronectin type III domain-containing protein [Chloroflexota bacterium]